jgi:hypothetical protein
MAVDISVSGYADLEAVGRGGLGDVYRARRCSDSRHVAIKVLRDDGAQSHHRVARELTALRAVGPHPHVISPIEVIELPQGPALVMEFAPGGSVAEVIRMSGPLTLDEAVFVGRQAAAGLAAVHACEIVHRDVKPQNLLIDATGQIKLCDFGIAAILTHDEFRTRTNAVSMQYASPEDLEPDAHVEPASDVYSLGAALLYAWRQQTLTIKDRLVPWRAPAADGPRTAAFDRLIESCLQPTPADRPDARQLEEAFTRLAIGGGTRIVTSLGRRRVPAVDTADTVIVELPPLADGVVEPEPQPAIEEQTTLDPVVGEAPVWRLVPLDQLRRRPRRGTGAGRWLVVGCAAAVTVWVVGSALIGGDDASVRSGVASTAPAGTPVPSPPRPVTLARPAGLAPLLEQEWLATIGECVVQVAGRTQLEVVECSEPHDLQHFAAGTIPGDGAFDAEAVAATVSRACDEAMPGFVGTTPAESSLEIAVVRPSPASWAAGDRSYACFLGIDGQRLFGDARTSGW